MNTSSILLALLALMAFGYFLGRKRSMAVAVASRRKRDGGNPLHSLPDYYGYLVVAWCAIPSLLLLLLWTGLEQPVMSHLMSSNLPAELQAQSSDHLSLVVNNVLNVAGNGLDSTDDPVIKTAAEHYLHLQGINRYWKAGVVFLLALAGFVIGLRQVRPETRARNQVERVTQYLMMACASIAILTTLGIVLSVLFESLRFFHAVSLTDFLFGTKWSPQIAMRADQAGSSGAFGAVPLFVGTLLISFIALLVAVPLGLMSAIYLSEYASQRVRAITKPLLEVLAGIPTVVYGFFAALTVAPFLRDLGASLGVSIASESALAAGLVMGIMLIPFMSSLSDDVINAVPQSMRDGSYGMGATHSETIRQVIIPAALPGIVGAFLLAASRAIGETMIVVMAAGLAANLSVNPLEAVTTVTVQIVTLLTGDQEFDSPKTLAAFALGLTLFVVTLLLNVLALHIVRKYREQYE